MCQKLAGLREAMGSYAAAFDPALITAADAGVVVEHATAIANMASTVAALAAAREAETSLWRRGGDRSAAHALARRTGTSVGAAADVLATGRRLRHQPATAAAALRGELSVAQASVVSGTAEAAPGATKDLLERAKTASLSELKDHCGRTRAAAGGVDEAHRRIHRSRHLRRYTDAEGAANIHVRNTPEAIAEVMSVLSPIAARLGKAARARGEAERDEALAADALGEMARMASGAGGEGHGRPDGDGHAEGGPTRRKSGVPATMLFRVDLEAFVRGYPVEGEVVELAGYGPVPVSVVREMIESNNPFLVAIATKGVDVVNVAHLGRRFSAHQRHAFAWLYPTCSALGCGRAPAEIDHRRPWIDTKVSLLRDGDPYCGHHHYLKTHRGWALVGGKGVRPFVPPTTPAIPTTPAPMPAPTARPTNGRHPTSLAKKGFPKIAKGSAAACR
jgi:hypothetical protein